MNYGIQAYDEAIDNKERIKQQSPSSFPYQRILQENWLQEKHYPLYDKEWKRMKNESIPSTPFLQLKDERLNYYATIDQDVKWNTESLINSFSSWCAVAHKEGAIWASTNDSIDS